MPAPPNLSTSHADGTGEVVHASTINDITSALNIIGVQVFNVKAYGAVGDNSTNDTAAIQAAINAAKVTQTLYALTVLSGVVYFPVGIYRVTSLSITSGVILQGVGKNSSVIRTTSGTADVISCVCDGSVVIRDLFMDATVTRTAGAFIKINGSSADNTGSIISNVELINGFNGIDFIAASGFIVENVHNLGFTNYGIGVQNTFNGDAGDSSIHSCYMGGGSSSSVIYHQSSGGLKITGCKFNGGAYGYNLVLGASTTSTSDLMISACSFEGMTQSGISFSRASGTTVFANITITGNQFALNAVCDILVNTAGSVFSNGVISGNIFKTNTNGVALVGGDLWTVQANRFLANSGASVVAITSTATNSTLGPNSYSGFTTGQSVFNQTSSTLVTDYTGIPFASIGQVTPCANGSIVYITDGTIASPVASGGTGCIAKRLNGVWVGN